MVEQANLPYFDFLLALLAQNNRSVELSFGRHVHWGYWENPRLAICDDEDYARAAEQLTTELCSSAGVSSGDRVLDVGCGFGGTIASLNERHEDLKLTGLNLDGRQLDRASQQAVARGNNLISFCQGDACTLPFANNSFDRVLAVECVFHFPSRERFFKEAVRVLRPGGTLALSDFLPSTLFKPLARLATEAPSLARFQYFGRCNLRYGLGDYRKLASEVGLIVQAERNITKHTLPTYRYLKNLLRHSASIAGITERAADLMGVVRLVAATGLLNYYLLTFRKQI